MLRGRLSSTRHFALAALQEARLPCADPSSFVRVTTGGGKHTFWLVARDGRRLASANYFATESARDAMLETCAAVCPSAAFDGGGREGGGPTVGNDETDRAALGPRFVIE